MELRQLQYFMTISDEGNFTRAAERLFVSQPALTQQIQKLEDAIGTTLLDRGGRGITLTAAGEILYDHAQRIFQEINEAHTAIQELEGLQRGQLRVGVVQTINAYLVPQVVLAFKQAHPHVHMIVEEMPLEQIEEGLRSGELQAGIGFTPSASGQILFEPLFDEKLVFVVPDEHPAFGENTVNLTDLDDVEMVMLSEGYCTRRLWDGYARQANIQPRITIEMNTIANVLAAVQQTGLPTILPVQITTELRGIPIVNPTPVRTAGMLWRKNSYRCQISRAFAEQVVISTPG